MEREFFLKTNRIGFFKWSQNDIELAESLWGDPEVVRYICAKGVFSMEDIVKRLNAEVYNESGVLGTGVCNRVCKRCHRVCFYRSQSQKIICRA